MISSELIGVVAFIVMLAGTFLGIHIGVVLGCVGFAGFVLLLGFSKSVSVLVTTPYSTVANYSFVVLPMFILMGEFAFEGGIGKLLYSAASRWLGHLRGGLAIATTAAAAFFAAVTGSSLATAATFGKIAVPEMLRYNYNIRLTCGVIAASGTFAVMIPPSGVMVLYCIFTEESLGKLMIAGILPGVMSVIIYVLCIMIMVKVNPNLAPRLPLTVSWKERMRSITWLTPIAIVMIIMLGGIYLGVFSPVEAGAVGAFTVFIVVLARRSLPLNKLKRTLGSTARTFAMISFVIVGAMIFGKLVTLSRLPNALMTFITGLGVSPIIVLIIILLIYVILGALLDVVAMLSITLPLFYPLLTGLGFDGIWLGILTVKIVEIAAVTPPIGMNVFVLKGVIGDIASISDMFIGILPFFLGDLITLGLLVVFPDISLWLPSKMFVM